MLLGVPTTFPHPEWNVHVDFSPISASLMPASHSRCHALAAWRVPCKHRLSLAHLPCPSPGIVVVGQFNVGVAPDFGVEVRPMYVYHSHDVVITLPFGTLRMVEHRVHHV